MNDKNLNETTFDENAQTAKKTFDIKKLIPIVIAVIVVFSIFKSCGGLGGGLFGGGVTDDTYIGCAKQIISKSLKNPSSLVVNDAYVYEKDDYGSAIVCMDITAENGYGGADRDVLYVCVMYVQSDGSYNFHPTCNYTEEKNNLEFLKNINGFGEPKE